MPLHINVAIIALFMSFVIPLSIMLIKHDFAPVAILKYVSHYLVIKHFHLPEHID